MVGLLYIANNKYSVQNYNTYIITLLLQLYRYRLSIIIIDNLYAIGLLNIVIGYCSSPTVGSWVHVEGNDSGLEGSQIIFRCQTGLVPSHSAVSNCTNLGMWLPDPSQLRCNRGTQLKLQYNLTCYCYSDCNHSHCEMEDRG